MSTAISAEPATSPTPRREYAPGRVFVAALAGGAAAAVANVVVYFVALAAGVTMTAQFEPGAAATVLPAFMPAVSSIVPAIGAAALMSALNVALARPTHAFVGIAVVFGVLSMGGPATLAEASLGTQLALAVMHVVAGVAITAAIVVRGRA